MINVVQIGIGPLGVKTFQYIQGKSTMKTIAAIDINPALEGLDLGLHCGLEQNGIKINASLSQLKNLDEIDVAILCTSSSIKSIKPQILEILDYNIPIVSTCEELTFPWTNDVNASQEIDTKAKAKGVAVVSTGVNPGFLMDTLPSMLTGVSKSVHHVEVKRIQDAKTRRIPFQKKIGAGLSLAEFDHKKSEGTLRHVGLTESINFIADSLGWELDHTEDVITPIICQSLIRTDAMQIQKGDAMGVRQIGIGSHRGTEKIKLVFEAAVGLGESYDEISISGEPNIVSKIQGGVHGDIATCSIVLNTIPNVLKATPGLKTMKDLSLVSFTP